MIDWPALSVILTTAIASGVVAALITYFITKKQADKHHKEHMEFERKKWITEQRQKNAPGLTDWKM